MSTLATSSNIVLLRDADLPEVATWNGMEINVRSLITKLRLLWSEQLGYTGEVCGVRVNPAYRLKTAPQEGVCLEDFRYLRGWDIPNEERTHDQLFLSPPMPCRHLLSKDIAAQTMWFRQMMMKYGLPKGFLSFGSLQAVSAMMLVHRTATSECLAQGYRLRTDSPRGTGGQRLELLWRDGVLFCYGWVWYDFAHSAVGGLVGGSLELPDTFTF